MPAAPPLPWRLSSATTRKIPTPSRRASAPALTEVRWVFARDLLAAGLYEPTGDGDVHVWPCLDARGRAVTIIELSSPDGEALMQARSDEVCEFLSRTEAIVPRGTEAGLMDVDTALGKILAAGSAEHETEPPAAVAPWHRRLGCRRDVQP